MHWMMMMIILEATNMRKYTCNEWFQLVHDGFSFSDRSINEVEEICIGFRGVEIRRFARVDHGTASKCKIRVVLALLCKLDRILKTARNNLVQ